MRYRSSLSILRWVSLVFIFCAVILTVLQLIRFSRIRGNYPPGQTIANVPVGGLDRGQAAQRLLETYAIPIEIHYDNAVIQVKPSSLGFALELESMLSAADLQRASTSFWVAFWDYIWNRTPNATDVPLRANFSEDRVRAYLENEIATRYDRPPTPAIPVPGSVNFQPGEPGTVLDIPRAIQLIGDAMKSPTSREVNLSINKTNPARPSMQNLQILIQQIIDLAKFDGMTELYLLNLETAEEIHFAYHAGQTIQPDIAFTAASTMKIPVMISVYRNITEPVAEDIYALLSQMIDRSDNESTDRVAQLVVNKDSAPLLVTQDMETLGLRNTFWAGYFYPGASLLKRYETPGNQRTDYSTDPDIYNQTTAADIGMLLGDIYECAENGGGSLIAAFPGEITQSECQDMITLLSGNHIAVLLQAGLPDGTQFAHKHGWVTETDGLIHTIGDAGIVFSPAGNYVAVIYLHQPNQLVFDPANQMVAQISLAIYNYFNQISQ